MRTKLKEWVKGALRSDIQRGYTEPYIKKVKKVKVSHKLSIDRHSMTITVNQIRHSYDKDFLCLVRGIWTDTQTDKINLINEALIDISELKINWVWISDIWVSIEFPWQFKTRLNDPL